MPRQMKHVSPIDSAGLNKNRPESESMWDKLENIRFHRGLIRNRPGLISAHPNATTTGAAAGSGVVLVEHEHRIEPVEEELLPDGAGNYAQWTLVGASEAAALAAITPTTYITSNTAGKYTSVAYGNLGTVTHNILSLKINSYSHRFGDATVKIYIRRSSTNTLISTQTPEIGGYLEPVILYTDPITEAAWTVTNVNNLEIVWELDVAGSAAELIYFAPVTVTGMSSNVLHYSKLYASSGDFSRMAEDLSAYTDIGGSVTAPTVEDTQRWDWCEFDGKIWMVNGTDDTYYYPDATTPPLMTELAAKPVGRTCAPFGYRLFLGDVIESGTRVKERVRWSKTSDGTDWSDDTAGNFDLEGTPGRIVKLLPKSELSTAAATGILVAYKEQGIYHITVSGRGDAENDPFDYKLMVGSIGCKAMNSVLPFLMDNGTEGHIFLGMDGQNQLNVFVWNGQQCIKVGDPVKHNIEDEADFTQLENAFATIDSERNYILAIATNQVFPTKAWVFNLDSKIWTTWTFGQITGFGQWKIENVWTTVCGLTTSLAKKFDVTKHWDD